VFLDLDEVSQEDVFSIEFLSFPSVSLRVISLVLFERVDFRGRIVEAVKVYRGHT
jgi:hypothetical protein